MRIDRFGPPKAKRRGSAIRHDRSGVGKAKSVVVGNRMHRSGYGEHGFVLEARVQHSGRKSEGRAGQSGSSQSPKGEENRSEGLSLACRIASTWTGGRQLYTSSRHSRFERFDASASDIVGRRNRRKESGAEGSGRCECKNRQCVNGCFRNVGAGDAGSVAGKSNEGRRDSQPGSRTITAQNPRHHRHVGRASDERSSPASGKPRAQTHALYRRDDQRTGSSNLRKAKAVLQTGGTGVHGTWDWTCRRGKHSGGNGNGHERRRAVCGLPPSGFVVGNLSRQ